MLRSTMLFSQVQILFFAKIDICNALPYLVSMLSIRMVATSRLTQTSIAASLYFGEPSTLTLATSVDSALRSVRRFLTRRLEDS